MKHSAVLPSALLMRGVAAHDLTKENTKESVSLAASLEKHNPLLLQGPLTRLHQGTYI